MSSHLVKISEVKLTKFVSMRYVMYSYTPLENRISRGFVFSGWVLIITLDIFIPLTETIKLILLKRREMILFPGVSSKVILRVLLPYIFSVIVILTVIAGYIHFTDGVCSQVVQIEQEQAIRIARSITGNSMNEEMSIVMFNSSRSNGSVHIELKPEFLELFNLSAFLMVCPTIGETQEVIPFNENSLAESAISSGSPTMQYIESGNQTRLLLFYPLIDSFGNRAIARMVFENVLGTDSVNSSRYNIFIMSVAAVMLILIPCLFLRLAGFRRKIEKKDFYNGDTEIKTENDLKITNSDICPSSILNNFEFPALFRLDSSGTVFFMNNTAEKLIDISKNNIVGIKFHELPCFSEEDRNLIVYPENEKPVEMILGIMDSSGSSRKSTFRIELLSNFREYTIAVRDERYEDGKVMETAKSGTDSKEHEEPQGSLSHNDIKYIRKIIEDCRIRSSENPACLNDLGIISDVLSNIESDNGMNNKEKADTIEIFSELDAITEALNDVLPQRASIEFDVPGFLPQVECSREDFTQIVKNLAFYSLESTNGPVRIKLGARDVPSPVSDSVFSANCDRTVSRSVSLSYTDGTRMPVVLKEALLDPETDLSGIQRDYGSHISSVAAVLSRHDCHPVFTERPTGTALNILFRTREDYLFDVSHTESLHRENLSSIKLAICDASRAVRESVSDILTMYGIDVRSEADLERMRDWLTESQVDFLVLDYSASGESMEEMLSNVSIEFPDIEIILTTGSSEAGSSLYELLGWNGRILIKPYSVDELLNIIEMSVSTELNTENELETGGTDDY